MSRETLLLDAELVEIEALLLNLRFRIEQIIFAASRALGAMRGRARQIDDYVRDVLLHDPDEVAKLANEIYARIDRLPIAAQPAQPHPVVCCLVSDCYVNCLFDIADHLSHDLSSCPDEEYPDPLMGKLGMTDKRLQFAVDFYSSENLLFLESAIVAEIKSARQRVATMAAVPWDTTDSEPSSVPATVTPVKPSPLPTDQPRIVLRPDERMIEIDGQVMPRLTKVQYRVFAVLVEALPGRVAFKTLINKSGNQDAPGVLDRIKRKGPHWDRVISMAGGSGNGYGIELPMIVPNDA